MPEPENPTPSSPPAATRPRPPRRPRRQSRVPVSIRYLLPLAAVVVGALAWRDAWVASRAFVELTGPAGAELGIDSVEMQLFAYADAPNAPSPTPALGPPFQVPSGAFSLGDDVVPELVLCRLSAPGMGVGHGALEAGGRTSRLTLGPPRPVRGQVLGADGVGLGGARVTILGGSPRGVVLAETTTAPDGWFRCDTVAVTVDPWAIRVVADRHAIHNRTWFPDATDEPEPVVRLERSDPASGRLIAIGDGAPTVAGRALRFFHVPGLSAETAADGSFRVEHLPAAPTRTAVLVPDLPPGWTMRRTRIVAGSDDTTIEIRAASELRGRVVNGHTGRAAAGVVVFHEHGPLGVETARTDASGRFTLLRVPDGVVEIHASLRVPTASLPPAAREGRVGSVAELTATAPTVVIAGRPAPEVFLEVR